MATLVSLIPRSIVIWFGSLKFMSTGFSYDMILLSIKGPGGARIVPARSKAPRWPRHHASPPKKKRWQHRHHPIAVARAPPHARQAAEQEPAASRAKAMGTMSRRQDGYATASGASVPRAPSPPSALLPHGLFAARRTYPFGLDNATTSLTKTICLGASLPGRTLSDHWSPRAMPRHSSKLSQWPNSHIFHECMGSDA
jgi:hypothetical protein